MIRLEEGSLPFSRLFCVQNDQVKNKNAAVLNQFIEFYLHFMVAHRIILLFVNELYVDEL